MNEQNSTQPNRLLSVNFTNKTLRRAIKAKRRIARRLAIRELLQMKKQLLLKQPIGAVIALAIVILGGAGVYAAANWFGGAVGVKSDDSIMAVDLTKCESNIPPGVGPKSDRSNIQFKITGTPHISPEELERKLLINCEFDSVLKFYQDKFGAPVGTPAAIVKSVDTAQSTITFELKWGRQDYTKTFKLAPGFAVMDKGQESDLASLKPGDYVMFAYKFADELVVNETDNPFDHVTEVLGVFKTQYDTREFLEDAKSLYDKSNIMPLDQYNQLQKK